MVRHRLDDLILDRSVGVVRVLESCVQYRSSFKFVPKKVDLRGKVAVVTGGSSGVGHEVVKELALMGADVYTGCRRIDRVQSLKAELEVTAPRNPGRIHPVYLDLADLKSVKDFSSRVADKHEQVDIAVLAAAIAGKPYKPSSQGHEIHWATNHLGHFALTNLLLDRFIKANARVVVVDSILHTLVSREGRPTDKFTSLPLISLVPGWLAYCSSNLSKLWFGYELQRRYPDLTVPVLHPGVIDSELSQVPTEFLTWIKSKLLLSPQEGAFTPLYAATADDVKGGVFYHNVLGIIPSSAESYDPIKAAEHWDLSKRLCMEALGPNAFPEEADQPRVIKPGEGLVIGDERGGGRAEEGAGGRGSVTRTPAGAMVYEPQQEGGVKAAVKGVGAGREQEGGKEGGERGVERSSSGAVHSASSGSTNNGDGTGRNNSSGRM